MTEEAKPVSVMRHGDFKVTLKATDPNPDVNPSLEFQRGTELLELKVGKVCLGQGLLFSRDN